MAKAKNAVIAGDYEGKKVTYSSGKIRIDLGISKKVEINKETIENYELITDEHRKSAASGAARGLVGGFLLGPVGLIAGGLSAKSKGIYQVAIEFKDGTKSLVELDDKIYKELIRVCF